MRIEKLEVRGFGKLTDLNLGFGRGLNIIFGRNESGKTSLQWFIKSMFFGLKGGRTSKDGVLPPLKRYKPWNASDFSGFLEYRLDNDEFFRVGRNFSTNSVKILDINFNDITDSFEQSREKGAHFAEKHLGVSEICFDKTVFIKQMESRIGEDGTGELINRLINVGQTGFEDISFNKAREALKEALKKHVGTDKTTTRPLDKVNVRLDELQRIKLDILKKRESLFDVENELKTLIKKKGMLEKRREDFVRIRETANISETVAKNRKLREELDGIIESIRLDEAALESAEEKLKDIEREKEQLYKFSAFNADDTDKADIEYSRFNSLLEDNRRISNEMERKKNDLQNIELQLEKLKAFNYMDENVEDGILELNREIGDLRRDYSKSGQEELNEKINNTRRRERGYIYKIAASAALSAVFIFLGITGVYVGYAAAAVSLAAAFTFFALKHREAGKLTELLDEKRLGLANISGISEEVSKRQKKLEEMCKAVGASGIEDFLVLKTNYNNLIRQLEALNNDIGKLERNRGNNVNMSEDIKTSITGVMYKAGIVDDAAAEVSDDMIKKFRIGVRKYKELEPNITYTKQRIRDLKDGIRRYYKNACSISGMQCCNKEELTGIVEHICEEAVVLEDQLKSRSVSDEVLAVNDSIKAERISDSDIERTDEEIKEVMLKIKECETILKSEVDDDELQRVIEETEALKERKSELEDVNSSLKTALEVLTEASTELQRDFMPSLNLKMSNIINEISCGRYEDLRADDNLMLRVIAPETGDVVTAPTLSGGTVDQMYLALRVAMADLIGSGNEKLPFIMDEALAQYDDDRTKETLKFLFELSGERQIIMFTCKAREVDIAKEVCGAAINIIELA